MNAKQHKYALSGLGVPAAGIARAQPRSTGQALLPLAAILDTDGALLSDASQQTAFGNNILSWGQLSAPERSELIQVNANLPRKALNNPRP